jgi:tight adherence protein B
MVIMQLLVSATVFVAIAVAAWIVGGQLVLWWRRRTAKYAAWLVEESSRLRTPMTTTVAERVIAGAIFGPAVLGYALGGFVPALALGAAGAWAPTWWIRYRLAARHREMDNQLVDALILMANGMKSGLSLFQVIELAADEIRPPLGDELSQMMNELRLGRLIDDALRELAGRLELPDLEIAVHSILTLRETGGNLSDTFMTVASTIAERKKVEGRIQTLTAQGLYQGIAVCAMPFIFAALFYFMDPEYMRPMFTTVLGWLVWTVIIVLDVLGMWMITKIVKIDV